MTDTPEETPDHRPPTVWHFPAYPPDRDWIALTLAIGLATALNLIVAAILYDAVRDPANAGISENATQILTGWGGGIIGILGAVFGYKAGQNSGTGGR